MFARGRKTKQLSETRFVRLAGRTIAIRLDPFWMLDAQSIVNLSLKLSVRADLTGRRNSLRFHEMKHRHWSNYRYFA